MKSIYLFLLVFVCSPLSFADGPKPTAVAGPHEDGGEVAAGPLYDLDKNAGLAPHFFFVARVPGLAGDCKETRDGSPHYCYFRIRAASVIEKATPTSGNSLGFLDFDITPITKLSFEQSIEGERKYLREYGRVNMQYLGSKYGHQNGITVYPIGFGYSTETVLEEDEESKKAQAEELAEQEKNFDDPYYDPLSSDEKAKPKRKRDLSKTTWTKFAELSADVLGVRYLGMDLIKKSSFVGIQFLDTRVNMGVSRKLSKNTKVRVSLGGALNLGLMGQIPNGSHLRIKDVASFGNLDCFSRTEFLVNTALGKFKLSAQLGLTMYPNNEETYGGLGQSSAALQEGEGGNRDNGSGNNGGWDGLFGGGGSAKSDAYLLFTTDFKF